MKKSVYSALLLSALGTSTSFAAVDLPTTQNLTPQEMSSVVGEGYPIFAVNYSGRTFLFQWDAGHTHQYWAPPGVNYYAWHNVNAGNWVQMQCQSNVVRVANFVMPAGNYVLNCF